MGLVIVGLIVIVVVGIIAFQALSGENEQTMQGNQNSQGSQSQNSSTVGSTEYSDGTYEAIGSYITPGGTQEVGVRITLTNGIIEEAEVEELGTLEISKEKQADFAANYKPMVIGKNIDEVNLGKVSGSSLTPVGFNKALDQIKEEASS